MRVIAITPLVVLAGMLAGCGGASSAALPLPPHGGTMIALPNNRGFVEILTDRGRAARDNPRAQQNGKAQVIAYFYEPDGRTKMSPAPTEVKVKIGTSATGAVVSLAPQPKEAGMFASDPGTYPDGFRGEVTAKIGGESTQISFLIR
jgi:hypothetical protein